MYREIMVLTRMVVVLAGVAFNRGEEKRGIPDSPTEPTAEKEDKPGSVSGSTDSGKSESVVPVLYTWFGTVCVGGLAHCTSDTGEKTRNYVLVSGKKTYKLESNIELAKFVGRSVRITGSRTDNVIKVTAIGGTQKYERPGSVGA